MKKSEKLHTRITYRGWCAEALIYNGRGDQMDYFSPLLLSDPNGMAKTWLSHGIGFSRAPYLQSYLYIKRINNIQRKRESKLIHNRKEYQRIQNAV